MAEEKIDIDEAKQKEILEAEVRSASNNLFDVLGVPSGAEAEEVKNAFHALSRKFHPDRFYGKQLGPFRQKLDKIFKRLVEANQTLTDAAKRASYLESNPFVRAAIKATSPSAVAASPAAPKSAEDEARDAERRARLSRHPYLAKASKVQEHVRRAKDHVAKQEYAHAFTQLNLAVQIDPQNAEAKAMLVDVRRKNEEQRSETDLKRGLDALEKGDQDAAVKAFRAAANANARNGVAAFRAGMLMEKQGVDVKEVSSYLTRAVEADPKNVEYRVHLGRVLTDAGMKALGKKHFDEAVRLAPDHPEVKKHVKKR